LLQLEKEARLEKEVRRLYSGSIQALFRLYSGSIQALLRLLQLEKEARLEKEMRPQGNRGGQEEVEVCFGYIYL
jgi:hypothetical protein